MIEATAGILVALAGLGAVWLVLTSRTLRRLARWADGWSEVGPRLPKRPERWP